MDLKQAILEQIEAARKTNVFKENAKKEREEHETKLIESLTVPVITSLDQLRDLVFCPQGYRLQITDHTFDSYHWTLSAIPTCSGIGAKLIDFNASIEESRIDFMDHKYPASEVRLPWLKVDFYGWDGVCENRFAICRPEDVRELLDEVVSHVAKIMK